MGDYGNDESRLGVLRNDRRLHSVLVVHGNGPYGTGRRNSDPPRHTHGNYTDEAEGLARGVGGDVTT